MLHNVCIREARHDVARVIFLEFVESFIDSTPGLVEFQKREILVTYASSRKTSKRGQPE